MRPNQNNNNHNNNNKNRMRGRSRKPQNLASKSFESNGPDVKVRGTAHHIAEKYMTLGRDAQVSGERILAENYFQHAEHYNRLIAAAQAQNEQQQARYNENRDNRDDNEDDTDGNDQPQLQPQQQSREPQAEQGQEAEAKEQAAPRRERAPRRKMQPPVAQAQEGPEAVKSEVEPVAAATSEERAQEPTVEAGDAEPRKRRTRRRRLTTAEEGAGEQIASEQGLSEDIVEPAE